MGRLRMVIDGPDEDSSRRSTDQLVAKTKVGAPGERWGRWRIRRPRGQRPRIGSTGVIPVDDARSRSWS